MPEVKIEIEAVTQAAENALRRFQTGAERIFAGIVSAATVTAIVQFGRRLVDLADNLNKMSQRVGESVEFLSTFRFAAKLSNVELGELEVSLKAAARTLVNAAQGGREANEVLDRLGISARNADGSTKRLSDLLFEVADRFKAMPDGVEKTDAALALFGRSGENLIPLLNQGSDGLRRMQNEARRLGLEISGLTARQAEELNDNLTRLNETLNGFGLRVLHDILPPLLRFTDAMTRLAADTEGFRRQVEPAVVTLKALGTAALGVYFAFFNIVRVVAVLLAPTINGLIDLIGAIPKAFDNLTSGLAESMLAIAEVFKTFGTLGTGLKQMWERDFIAAAFSFDKFSNDLKARIGDLFKKNETESPFAPIAAAFKNTMEETRKFSEHALTGMLSDFVVFKRLLETLWGDTPVVPTPQRRTTTDDAGTGSRVNQRDNTVAAAGQIGLLINQAERDAARISADATKDQVQKKRELLPLLAEQNELLMMQAEIYLHLRAAARTDKERLEIDQQLDAIRAKTAQLRQEAEELNSRNFFGEMQRGVAALSTEWGNFGANVAKTALEGIGSAVQGVTDSIMGAIDGTKTWGEVFAGVAKGIITNLIQVVVQWIAKMTIIAAMQAAFDAIQKKRAGERAAAEAPGAALAATSSYGMAAIIGGVALAAILALALSQAFATGGLVQGNGGPTADNVLARVSPGEYVLRQAAVDHYGLGMIEAMNNLSLTKPLPSAGASVSSGAAVNVPAPQVTVIHVYNEQELRRVLETEMFRSAVIKVVNNNRRDVGIPS